MQWNLPAILELFQAGVKHDRASMLLQRKNGLVPPLLKKLQVDLIP
jgi:hypothetical protein